MGAYLPAMARIELWTGLPGSGRIREALELMRSAVRNGRSAWWITETQRQAETVETKLLDLLDGSLVGVEITVAGRLPMHLLQAVGRSINAVATEVREIVLRELVDDFAKNGELPVEGSEGWARRIAEFYLRLQAGDVELEKNLRVHYPWALQIVERYTVRLAKAGLIDESDLPAIAKGLIAKREFSAPHLVIVDRLGPLLPPTMELIRSLAAESESAVVLLDDVKEAGSSLAISRQQKEQWLTLSEVRERPFASAGAHVELARNLFVRVAGENEKPLELRAEVQFTHHPDKASEVRAAARLLARRVHDDGVEPSSMAVICTRLEDYEAPIRELFPRYGLLPDIRLGPRLDTNPVAKVTLSLFDLRARGLSRERVTDLLLGPYVRWRKILSRKDSVLAFDSVARAARIRDSGGSFEEIWRQPLEEEMRRRSDIADAVEEESEDEGTSSATRVRRMRREISDARKALTELADLDDRIRGLPDPCTVVEALEWLESLLRELGVIDAANRTARRDPQLGGDDVRALGHLKLTLQHVSTSFAFHERDRWPVERFAETLRFALRTARLRPSNRLRGGVPVAGPLELRGLETEELVMLGMTADAWPRSPDLDLADPFGARWSLIDRLAESRALTFEALLSSKRVTFSSPTPRKGEGRDAPSPLLAEIRAAGVRETVNGEEANVLRSPLEVLPRAGAFYGAGQSEGALLLLQAASENSSRVHFPASKYSLEVEGARQNPATLTKHEGFLVGGDLAERIAHRVLSRPLSATRLDSYARCPMQFFLGHALEITPLEDVEDDIDPRQIGGAVHDILARTVEQLHRKRGSDPDLSEGINEVAEVMHEVASKILGRAVLDNLYGDLIVRSLLSGLTDANEPVGHLFAMLVKNNKDLAGDRVRFVEAAFGLPVEAGQTSLLEDPIRIEKDGVTVSLVGRIDRIDLHPEKGWRIFDYKLSARPQPSARVINMGLSFQLPLYTWALEEWLSRESNVQDIETARYFQLKPEAASLSNGWKKKDHDESSGDLKDRVIAIHHAINAGRFHHPLSPEKELCEPNLEYNYCPFKTICRRDHSLFEQRPENLQREYLDGAYRLSFQRFANGSEGTGDA
ncbi:MAG: PD-(D/E)XK nuclease family protein [bacterium]